MTDSIFIYVTKKKQFDSDLFICEISNDWFC